MKTISLTLITLAFASIVFAQSVTIRDSADETLMIVNDEDTGKSSITIPLSTSAFTGTNDKLYNLDHLLYWNGSELATTGGADSDWSGAGTGKMYATSTSDNVGIGTTDPVHKLTVEQSNSSGRAGLFWINNALNPDPAIRGYTSGLGNAGRFDINNSSNTESSLYAATNGEGNAIEGYNSSLGRAAFFHTDNSGNGSHTVEVHTNGGGSALDIVVHPDGMGPAIRTTIDEPTNSSPGILVEVNGTGPAISANRTIQAPAFSSTSPLLLQTGGTTRIYADDSNGYVGIGTTSPAHRLHIQQDGSDLALHVNQNGTGGAAEIAIHYGSNSNHALTVSTYGTGHAINAYTTNSGAAIRAGTPGGGGTAIFADGTVEMNSFAMSTGASAGYVLTSDGGGGGTWQAAAGGADSDWSGAGTGKMYATSTGDNVGIGITNPLSKLSVGGNGAAVATIYGETSTGRAFYGLATNSENYENYGGYFEASGTYGRGVYGGASGSDGRGVYGKANGSSGRGVYGETSGGSGKGVYGIASNTGNVSNTGGHFESSGGSGTGVYGSASNSGSGTNYGGYFSAAGSDGRGVYGGTSGSSGIGIYGYATGVNGKGVVGHGNVAITSYDFDAIGPGVDYGATSSIRWKRNIVEINNPLEKLSELRGIYFNWDEEHGGHHDVGCIAEEVGKVLPEIVVYEENGIDADGMDYSKLTPLLIEAVKELKKIVEDQHKRIEYLESN